MRAPRMRVAGGHVGKGLLTRTSPRTEHAMTSWQWLAFFLFLLTTLAVAIGTQGQTEPAADLVLLFEAHP